MTGVRVLVGTREGAFVLSSDGQVDAPADAGDNRAPIVRDLPAVLSAEVQTLS